MTNLANNPGGGAIQCSMKFTALALAAVLSTSILAAQTTGTENQDARKVAHSQAKIDHTADKQAAKLSTGQDKTAYKAQAKADKNTAKALNTRSAKKAAKSQDKANTQVDKAVTPQ